MGGLYPLALDPRFKARVWGGRRLETLYGKRLPPDGPIGESWEIADRPDDESVVVNGPLAGRTLRWLMNERRADLLGRAAATTDGRFPLLCKILDARDILSVQVHPPERARDLGEPKTEMWYIADAVPGAELFAGLRRGVTLEQFEAAIRGGGVANLLHRLPVAAGDVMFLPSGRLHAIGAGLVIFEIQQNSDTTFRVYDWDRVGLDGVPRQLHIRESLASIDFGDAEPSLVDRAPAGASPRMRQLVHHPLFDVSLLRADAGAPIELPFGRTHVVACVSGAAALSGGGETLRLAPGNFCLMPARLTGPAASAAAGTELLIAVPS